MCEFCHKHGEGKKWYLEAKNYAEDLLADARRRRFVEHFFMHPEILKRDERNARSLDRLPPAVRSMVVQGITRRQKKVHFGQVVPIEDVERIFSLVNSVVRLACICRHVSIRREARYCYGVSLGPDGGALAGILRGLDRSFVNGPEARGLETLAKDEALSAIRSHEHEGLCHTVWTFQTPFIGGLCNCDRTDCMAMRWTVTNGIPVMFRAETIAAVDPDACNGCRTCMRVCQFGALSFSASSRKCTVDNRFCYGCGVCRAACSRNAIRLEERTTVPAAQALW
jgi:NAD-dependent dihydropyrimidine dehydrogenase PreA subunit